MEDPDARGPVTCRASRLAGGRQPLLMLSLSLLPPDAAGLGLGAALLAHTQVHRTLPPHPQSNPILLGQMTAGGGAREP